MTSLYKTPESKKEILALHQTKLESLNFDDREQEVAIQFDLSLLTMGETSKLCGSQYLFHKVYTYPMNRNQDRHVIIIYNIELSYD